MQQSIVYIQRYNESVVRKYRFIEKTNHPIKTLTREANVKHLLTTTLETHMARKFYIAYVSLTALALLAGAFAFTSSFGTKAHAQESVKASSVRCFIGYKMDRPDQHMSRGWVCLQESAPAVIN